jgi:hypothetical protein
VLLRHQVRFVVIGGIAAISHGYPLPTEDVDVTPSRDRENVERLARALQELDARLRSASDATGVPTPKSIRLRKKAMSGRRLLNAWAWPVQVQDTANPRSYAGDHMTTLANTARSAAIDRLDQC